MIEDIRTALVKASLRWQEAFGNAPAITGALGEFDAAMLVDMSVEEYSKCMRDRSVVAKDWDFRFRGKTYQIRSNRPSGRAGSIVTLVGKPKQTNWDFFIWILYDKFFVIQEAWLWDVESFRRVLYIKKRIGPKDVRQGKPLFPNGTDTSRL